MASIVAPLAQFFAVSGAPLDAGYVYIGEAGGNPETAPVAVYWDEDMTQPAAQPLRTSRGFIARGGSPAAVYVSGDYSLTVRQRTRELVLYAPRLAGALTRSAVSTSGDPGYGGIWPDVSDETKMVRVRDRLFVFDGAAFNGTRNGSQGGFIPTTADGHNWAIRDSMFLTASRRGLMGVTGYVSNEDMDLTPGEPDESIGVSGFGKGVQAGLPIWGGYFDLQMDDGNYGYGIEIGVKNKTNRDETSTPYFATTGTFGIWLQAGAGAGFGTGGAATDPCNTAIMIGKNGQTWNKGIVFLKDGLTGSDGTTGTATAIEMGKGQSVVWRAPGNLSGLTIRSDVSAASSSVSMIAINSGISFLGHTGGTILQAAHQTSGVNFLQVANGANGSPVTLTASIGGTDTNLDLRLVTQGTGTLRFGTHSALAAETVTGYITIKDSGGTVRKLAVVS